MYLSAKMEFVNRHLKAGGKGGVFCCLVLPNEIIQRANELLQLPVAANNRRTKVSQLSLCQGWSIGSENQLSFREACHLPHAV